MSYTKRRYCYLLKKEKITPKKMTVAEKEELDLMCPSKFNGRMRICQQCQFKDDCGNE